MDNVLVCIPDNNVLQYALDLTADALIAVGFELHQKKVQGMPSWRFLGLEITSRTIQPQKLVIKENPRTLADLQQLYGSLNCIRLWPGITTEDLGPLLNLLGWGQERNWIHLGH